MKSEDIPTKEVFRLLAELRLLLTSNYSFFESGQCCIDQEKEINLYWNGKEQDYDFVASSPDILVRINRVGFPLMTIKGHYTRSMINEILVDGITEISKLINDYIINFEKSST